MSWSSDLWDGFDKVTSYFADGINLYEKFEDFLRERCIIENTYAKSLRKLVKNFEFNKKLSNKDLDEDKLTHLQCFSRMLSELKNIATQHELIAENTQKKIFEKLSIATKSFKEDRKKFVEEKDRLYSLHANSEKLLKKRKQQYELSFKELEKAKETLTKLENDCNSSRSELKKNQTAYEQKLRVLNLCKSDYAKYMSEANQIKDEYFNQQLPHLLYSLQSLEEKRIRLFQHLVLEVVSIEAETLPRMQRALKEIEECAHGISIKNDIESVVIMYKTHNDLPDDHKFEDLSDPRVIAARLNASKILKKANVESNESATTKQQFKADLMDKFDALNSTVARVNDNRYLLFKYFEVMLPVNPFNTKTNEKNNKKKDTFK